MKEATAVVPGVNGDEVAGPPPDRREPSLGSNSHDAQSPAGKERQADVKQLNAEDAEPDDPLQVFQPRRPTTTRPRGSYSPGRHRALPPSHAAERHSRSPRRASPCKGGRTAGRRGGRSRRSPSDSRDEPNRYDDPSHPNGRDGRERESPCKRPSPRRSRWPSPGDDRSVSPLGLFHDEDGRRREASFYESSRQESSRNGRRREEKRSRDRRGRSRRRHDKDSDRGSSIDRRITDFVRDNQLDDKVTRIMLNMNPDDVEQVLEEGVDPRRCRNPTAVVVSRIRKIERAAGRPNAMKRYDRRFPSRSRGGRPSCSRSRSNCKRRRRDDSRRW